ncbi:MAG: hydantoinase/oxoprolinase family protein [bacterium]|nr:hydantoinase/oxoprolinase family protein [bacterium]
MRQLRIGVDAGGTFTDFAVFQPNGRLDTFKIRSNPASPAAVILTGIERAAGGGPAEIIHGSTVATNALLERKGARTAFLTTEGFEDLILIGRQNRRELYNLSPPPRRPLAPRERCFGVPERTHFDGVIAKRPTAAALRRLRARLRGQGVESIAVCLLHSYRNPANEKAVAEALDGLGYLSCSHEVSPEFREYERASTTVINAYVGPLMDEYLGELARAARHRISILQSNGGWMTTQEARSQPVRTVLSGPAGGVVGALAAARASGLRRIVGFDMGGTSTDVSLAEGRARETTESAIDGFPIRVPMIDIHTVGAGGGSIARVDAGGLLRVGPESAGAEPGPACYGTGSDATVTDAHVVLGRIQSRQFLGGEMALDAERAAAAVSRIAGALATSVTRAAAGILEVANANMERAIRAISIERGYDPREFALVAFGGCGALHACDIAAQLGMRSVIVPQNAGVLSALGMLMADRVRDYSAGALGREDLDPLFAALERRAQSESPDSVLERMADIRYRGQSYELTLPWRAADPARLFHREHKRVYGYASQENPVEVVTLRVRARSRQRRPKLKAASGGDGGAEGRRRVYIGNSWHNVPVLARNQLPSKPKPGPALLLDYGSTTLVPSGWRFHVDRAGNVLLSASSGD